MLQPPTWGFTVRFEGLALMMLAAGPASAVTPQPVAITWQEGRCADCQIASQLDSVVFTSSRDAWAEGFTPPGDAGLGEYVILHSRDGGRTWRELHWTYSHNTPAPYSFPGGRHGWIAYSDNGWATWKFATVDTGGRIRREIAPERDGAVNALTMRPDGSGYAVTSDGVMRTTDGGRTWQVQKVSGDAIVFADPLAGWMATGPGRPKSHSIVVRRTIDGGVTWSDTPLAVPDTPGDIIGLWFADKRRGWLSLSYANGFHRTVWRTTDGGVTWAPDTVLRAAETSPDPWVMAVGFTDASHGFAFARGDSDKRAPSDLLYTADGGDHWRKVAFDGDISACRPWQGALKCAATRKGKGFWIVTLKPD